MILFYGRNHFLSQFYACRFEDNGVVFTSAEQYFQYQKALMFDDDVVAPLILDSDRPEIAKMLGKRVWKFNPEEWEKQKFDVAVQGNILKFSQNPELKELLLNTGNDVLAEASPRDKIWGIGMGKSNPDALNPQLWRGQNLLGKALMQVREILRQG